MANRKPSDPKVEALRKSGALNPHPQLVRDELFVDSDFFDPRDLVQVRYEMLRRVQKEREPVTRTVANFGFSRPTFYKTQADFARGGLPGLVPEKRGPRRRHKLTSRVRRFVEAELDKDNTLGPSALARLVEEHLGLRVHPSSISRALRAWEKKRR